MPSLPLPFTCFAGRRPPLRQASARLLAFGVAAMAAGTIMVGAGLETVPAMPPLFSLAVEHVMAASVAPEAATVGRRTLPLLTTQTHVMPPRPAPETAFDLDRRAYLLAAAIQARSPAREEFVTNAGRQGTASFCPSPNAATCRPAE